MPTPSPTSLRLTVPRLLALLAGVISVLVPPASYAIDAGDMDPHLPKVVVLATMRFHSYTRRAEDKQEWEQKHAELLKMLEAQLDVVSLSDNRAATALRTLIADFKDARFVTPKKTTRVRDDYPRLPDGNRLLVQAEFHIDSPNKRSLTYPFQIKEVPALIQIGIAGGKDNSGDKGLRYLLIDPVGRVIKRGFSKVDNFVWEKHEGTRNGTWKVIIEDLDTDLDDKHSPGNRGAIEVLCKTG